MPRKRKRGVVGRSSRLTIDVAIRLGATLRHGVKVKDAALAAGVSRPSLYRWLALGRTGDPRYLALIEAAKDKRPSWLFWKSIF